ncbi:hypothetical protein DL89DRAFT_14047 [Linderina pennispora]|uniref:Uncharacterized protein n=1 Tax=Linderina pennispora TaxID=61395 RepID=A0A1Y1WM16_9FUNG|nr:uncharacterized protein DL89DRAFT_14047 [Linderina pennispora]ORX74328.1 hypothetical protein DL89DRAFT_14047 [Linderina pennispora]
MTTNGTEALLDDELSGLLSSSGAHELGTQDLHNDLEGLSEVGRAISPREARMAFPTNISMTPAGVARRRARPASAEPASTGTRRGHPSDGSLTHMSDSVWQLQGHRLSVPEGSGRQEMLTMDFSSHSTTQRPAIPSAAQAESQGWAQNEAATESGERLPTFSSPHGEQPSTLHYEQGGQRKKKKKKVRRERNHRTILDRIENGFTEQELQEASQDTSTDSEERFNMHGIMTAFTSARLSDASLSPLTEDQSIVEQRRNELQQRIESLDNDIDNDIDNDDWQRQQQHQQVSYSQLRQRFLNGPQSSSVQSPVVAQDIPTGSPYPMYAGLEIEYPARRLGKRYFSTQTYDHPNIESPYSSSAESSMGPADRAIEEYWQAQQAAEMQDKLSHHNPGH